MYKWTDANGVRHYTNDPPPEGISASSSWDEIVKSSEGNRHEQNTATDARETPVTVIGNSIIVPVTFRYRGRQYPMKLLLDTGAEYTVVYEFAARKRNIGKFVPAKAQVAGGRVIDAKRPQS